MCLLLAVFCLLWNLCELLMLNGNYLFTQICSVMEAKLDPAVDSEFAYTLFELLNVVE